MAALELSFLFDFSFAIIDVASSTTARKSLSCDRSSSGRITAVSSNIFLVRGLLISDVIIEAYFSGVLGKISFTASKFISWPFPTERAKLTEIFLYFHHY